LGCSASATATVAALGLALHPPASVSRPLGSTQALNGEIEGGLADELVDVVHDELSGRE
jgi:hypothetical protein